MGVIKHEVRFVLLRLGPWLINFSGCVLWTMHPLDYHRRDFVLPKMEAATRTSL